MISVIIPIYNAEKTICRCLNSLKQQSLKDIEFLCIDDGSTDSSLAICKEYAHTDERFKVFHKDNEGVSATRQFGLEHSNGEYVIHLDADDYVDPSIYETMYRRAKEDNADIVTCDAYRITDSGKEYMNFYLEKGSIDIVLNDLIDNFGSIWNRLIRKDIISKTDCSFLPDINYGEDKIFFSKLLERCYNNSIPLVFTFIQKPLIFYDTTANENSLSKLSRSNWYKKRMKMMRFIGEELNMGAFGKTYYTHIQAHAYSAFCDVRNNTLSESEFISAFSPYSEGIKDYVSPSLKKKIVSTAIAKGIRQANLWFYCLAPRILFEKYKSWKKQFKA